MPRKGITQSDRILMYMREYGSITPLDALREFGCMRLAARISELSKVYSIERTMETRQNRYGERTTYARYSLNV